MIKLAALSFALLATPAMASLTGMTPEICAADEYLIGASGRSADWIAAIRPVCASWNPATRMAGAPRNGPSHGGRGGGEGVAICPSGHIQISNNVGKTAIISNKALCSEPTCDGFRLIECVD